MAVSRRRMLALSAADLTKIKIAMVNSETSGAAMYAQDKGFFTQAGLEADLAFFRTPADLNGKTLAVAGLGSFAQYSAQYWIDKNGGDSKTVKFVEVSPPEMPAALEAHRVDAAAPFEPGITLAHRAESSDILVKYMKLAPELASKMVRDEQGTVLSPELLQPNLDVLARYNALPNPVTVGQLVWNPR